MEEINKQTSPTLTQLRAQRDKLLISLEKSLEDEDSDDRIEAKKAIDGLCCGMMDAFEDLFFTREICPECSSETGRRKWASENHSRLYLVCCQIAALESAEYRKAMEAR